MTDYEKLFWKTQYLDMVEIAIEYAEIAIEYAEILRDVLETADNVSAIKIQKSIEVLKSCKKFAEER